MAEAVRRWPSKVAKHSEKMKKTRITARRRKKGKWRERKLKEKETGERRGETGNGNDKR